MSILSYNYFPYSGLINSITSFVLGFFVLSQNKKGVLHKRFFCFAFCVGFWAINYSLWLMSREKNSALFFIRCAMVGAIFIPSTFTYFVTYLIGKNTIKIHIVNFVLSTIFLVFSFSDLYVSRVEPKLFFPYWPVPGNLFHYMLTQFALNTIYAHVILWNAMKRSFGTKRKQLSYVFYGTLIGFIGGSTNYFLWFNLPIAPYCNILVSCFVLSVAYAIVRHQLMDIEVIIKKTLVFAGLFVASYAVFAGFAYIGSVFFEHFIQSRWIAMAPSILIIVTMLRPLEIFLRNTTDRFLFQKQYDYKQLLRTFTQEVLTLLDLRELIDLTANKLTEIMKLENAAVMLFDEDKGDFRMATSAGVTSPSFILNSNEEFIRKLRDSGEYILNPGKDKSHSMGLGLEKIVDELGSELVIPLFHGANMVGVLFFGKKKSDEEFAQDDIDILLPLARTLSVAITNARLFEKLSEAQAQAAQREKMAVIGTLSAGINHEICNPLGIARGQCEMFLLNYKEGFYKDKSLEELLEKARIIMEKVIHETDRATVITRKLSSFAKPSKNEVKDDVRLGEEIDEVISLVQHDLKLDNIFISKDVPDDLPRIYADKKQVQEILFNIIRNAAQAIKGRGSITVRAGAVNSRVYVNVEDTGEGITKSNLSRIFDPFFTTKEPGKGTGLGLFIVKQIVERNMGKISVESEPGKGTIFRLSFKTSAQAERV